MIERFYAKDALSFQEIDLEFSKGLHVFTGASGAGKSLLMQTLLSVFAKSDPIAKHAECSTSWHIEAEEFENESSNIFKLQKKEKSRFFFNAQAASKKSIQLLSEEMLQYLSTKEYNELSSLNLLKLLDLWIEEQAYCDELARYQKAFTALSGIDAALNRLMRQQNEAAEKREFLEFEIEKIKRINPVIGEDEDLMQIKKQLSKKEKIEQTIERIMPLFDYEHFIGELQELINFDSDLIDEGFNQLRITLDSANETLLQLGDVDIETVLNRIEQLGELKRKYGSLQSSIEALDTKKEELASLDNLANDTVELQQKKANLESLLSLSQAKLHDYRQKALAPLQKDLDYFSTALYLPMIQLDLCVGDYHEYGCDILNIALDNAALKQLSSGEFNRVRLALLAAKVKKSETDSQQNAQNVLILDEIDANLSGEESMSVARVLRLLAQEFQIFAISHQPQLSAMGMHHYLVDKNEGVSRVTLLNDAQRVEEIARIVGSNDINEHAMAYAKELLMQTSASEQLL